MSKKVKKALFFTHSLAHSFTRSLSILPNPPIHTIRPSVNPARQVPNMGKARRIQQLRGLYAP
jgi:hypothetical protein